MSTTSNRPNPGASADSDASRGILYTAGHGVGPGQIDPNAVTISGLVLDPVYGPDAPSPSLKPGNQPREVPDPGRFPYTRGLFPQGYRTRLWTMRQFAGFGSADDTNNRFKYLLAQAKTGGKESAAKANTGLSTAFDLPTLMGRDSDDPLSAGEVGRCGVAIDTVEDMHRLYADIPIDKVTVSQTINGPAAVIWAMYLAMAHQRGISWADLGGTLQNDILKEFHSQNEFIYPPEPSVKLVVDTIEFQSAFLPKWNSVSISGYHIREAGSTAVQELAFTLRDGMEYVEACLERGLPIDAFAPRLSFFFNSHNEFFEEVCKLRAARRIWARVMRDRYGAQNERSWFMKTHVQTAGCSLTEQQPLNNIVRVAYQAMAAVFGGCQSLHTDSMDETLGLPTEQAVTVALRTQQILAHETGVTRVADPLGGSWFVEALTDQMEKGALELIAEIDAMGQYGPAFETPSPSGRGSPSPRGGERGSDGHAPSRRNDPLSARSGFGRSVINGINKGYFRRAIAEASYRFSEEMEAGDRIIVGVNEYADPEENRPIDILEIPHQVETDQVSRLSAFKSRRNAAAVAQALDNIRAAAQGRPYALINELPGLPRRIEGESAIQPMSRFTEPNRRFVNAGPEHRANAGTPDGPQRRASDSGARSASAPNPQPPAPAPSLHPTNVMPALIDAALANCTLGEMVQAMADIYGRYSGGPEW